MGTVVALSALNKFASNGQSTAPTAHITTGTSSPESDNKGFTVAEAYELLQSKAGLRVRTQQEVLSAAVEESLLAGIPLIAEAPTGTGKTIAYIVGALAAYHQTQTPLVVATATVALQEQLVTGDLPRLVKAGLIGRHEVVVAKGRGRYLCTKSAEKLNDGGTSQLDIFDTAVNEKSQDLVGLPEMLEHFWSGAWDGDIDHWKQKQPLFWAKVQANPDTCTKTKCEHYDKCAFFKARGSLFTAKVVVANHDMVLADLAMAAEDAEPVFAFQKYNLVFDEAHHLPDKAMEHGRAAVDLKRIEQTLLSIPSWTEAALKQPIVAKVLSKAVNLDVLQHTSGALSSVSQLRALLSRFPADEREPIFQFEAGVLPESLRAAITNLHSHFEYIDAQMYEALKHLKNDKLAEALGPGAAALVPMQVSGSALYAVVRDSFKGLSKFLMATLPVKWLDVSLGTMALVASPLDGNEVLADLLWKSKRVVPVMVSATIRDFNGFERFAARVGAPEVRKELLVDPVLPYKNAKLVLPYMRNTPKQAERLAFEKELCLKMPADIKPADGGALVLVSSWRLMEKVKEALVGKFSTAVLVQGALPTKQLIEEHKRRVDTGRPSILLGVASLSEGLDLPGRYCTHVLIAAIPFASPVDPVERERSRQAGSKYFGKHSLPDALVKLIQMTGRLIRREDDFGTITVYDMRLRSMGFGRQLLKALPDYNIVSLPPSAAEAAALEDEQGYPVALRNRG